MLLQLLLPPPPPSAFSAGHLHHTNAVSLTSRRLLLLLKPPRSSSSPSPSSSRGRAENVDTFTKYSGYLFKLSSSEADSLTEYNISRITAIYRNKPLILIRRLLQITTTLGKWFALRYMDNVSERADQMFEVRAEELRKILVELGPAYIKIAQAISARPVSDLFTVGLGSISGL